MCIIIYSINISYLHRNVQFGTLSICTIKKFITLSLLNRCFSIHIFVYFHYFIYFYIFFSGHEFRGVERSHHNRSRGTGSKRRSEGTRGRNCSRIDGCVRQRVGEILKSDLDLRNRTWRPQTVKTDILINIIQGDPEKSWKGSWSWKVIKNCQHLKKSWKMNMKKARSPWWESNM